MHSQVSSYLCCLQEVKSVPEPWTLKDEPGSTHLVLERKYENEKVVVDLLIHEQVRPQSVISKHFASASCFLYHVSVCLVCCTSSFCPVLAVSAAGSEPSTWCQCAVRLNLVSCIQEDQNEDMPEGEEEGEDVDVDVGISFSVSIVKNSRALVYAYRPAQLLPARLIACHVPELQQGACMQQPSGTACRSMHDPPGLVSTRAGMRRFDCTSDGSYVEIVHVSLADEAALTGDEDDEAYEGPVRNGDAHWC